MDSCRIVTAAFVTTLTFSFAACFGSPTRRSPTTGAQSSSGTGSGGATASTGSAAGGAGGVGTGGAGMGGAGNSSTGPSGAGTGAGPSDGGYLDVAADAIGKGGLPEGAMCGTYATGDGGAKCGAGLSCCYPCKNMMCDTVCVLECNPQSPGCIGGCIPMP